MKASYVVPLRCDNEEAAQEFVEYLATLATCVEVIVVDGSPPEIFGKHRRSFPNSVLHLPVDPALRTPNGKVGGVLTGLRAAAHERVVIADDDVRYDRPALDEMVQLLGCYAVVRPQNYFEPLPWHAKLDTARTLLNRVTGGDWPGTVGVQRSYLDACGGYDGSVLFENLELVRTIRAAGGSQAVAAALYVRRLPSTSHHFFTQRVRQAYDEFARPIRMSVSLTVLPLLLYGALGRHWRAITGTAFLSVALAEAGRRIAGGTSHFPAICSVLAPLWILERATTSWLALFTRMIHGGVPYRGIVIRRAATSQRQLRRRHGMRDAAGMRAGVAR